MSDYRLFAKHYDAVVGDRTESTKLLVHLINKHCPQGESILELACGTGSVLKHLNKRYELHGLDSSLNMLSVARKKVSSANFSHQDMRTFTFGRTFDVIFCVFDSINHLLKLSDWKKVFNQAYRHLEDNGVFIFDMNTLLKLQRHSDNPPSVKIFQKNVLIMDVQDVGRGIANWNIKVFEHKKKNSFEMYEENIKEVSFPISKIKAALKRFSSVTIIDANENKPNKHSKRLYFVCKK
ncbi:class I SAM-dependent methyltransferase [Candidatus Uhrbacteria bacterium]|jgi:ubiquinone/menaquinone biosynthesis C-methylase UbiE|nr:class I SAM-dependent methyltransferase [Candidatus Uhrbacteria bacterium]